MTCIKEENFAVNPMVTNYVKHQEKLLSVAYFKGKISNIFRQSKVVKSNSNYCQGSSQYNLKPSITDNNCIILLQKAT